MEAAGMISRSRSARDGVGFAQPAFCHAIRTHPGLAEYQLVGVKPASGCRHKTSRYRAGVAAVDLVLDGPLEALEVIPVAVAAGADSGVAALFAGVELDVELSNLWELAGSGGGLVFGQKSQIGRASWRE